MKLGKYSIGVGIDFHQGKAQLRAIMKAYETGLTSAQCGTIESRTYVCGFATN